MVVFPRGERRKHPGWRAFTIITGRLSHRGDVLVQFDPDPLTTQEGGRQWMSEGWVRAAAAL